MESTNHNNKPVTRQEELIVSLGASVYSNKFDTISFEEIINGIRSDDDIKKKIENIKKISDKKLRKAVKQQKLMYFNMGLFKDDIRRNTNLITTQHLLFDYDTLTPEKLTQKTKELKKDKTVFVVFISPSGDGLKVIYKLDKEITDYERFSKIYKYYAAKFEINLGAEPDKTSDVSRPCFISYDPDIYVNYEAEPLTTDIEENISTDVKSGNKKVTLLEKLEGVSEGKRSSTLISIVGTMLSMGMKKDLAISILTGWNLKNNPPLDEKDLVSNISSAYERYKIDNTSRSDIVEKEKSYYRQFYSAKGAKSSQQISTFIIQPKELLTLPNKDCLVCDVETTLNTNYKDVLLENSDWHTRQKFLKALGHSDCVFLGSDRDLQLICNHINSRVPIKKIGTKVIGLYEERIWVSKDSNIDKDGAMKNIEVVPYDKGDESFYHKIQYRMLGLGENQDMLKEFYQNILDINKAEIILPWIGWLFVTPLKPLLKTTGEGFPLIFVHGSQGGGKTSTAKLFMRLCGYNISDPFSCTMRIFPMLKTLSSTNAIPVFLDEFKKSDMREEQLDNLLRFMRKGYMGEVESKGRADQTTEDYYITAPMCVMGEWNINQPALMERMLIVRFDGSVKKNSQMQQAFDRLKNLPLESFMPGYIEFCLRQNIDPIFNESKELVNKVFESKSIAPRVRHNLAVMVMGLGLFQKYAVENGITVPTFDTNDLLIKQLKEITGSDNGFVRSAVDQFLEELAVMVSIEAEKYFDYWAKVKLNKKEVLAIRFNEIYPLFREHIKKRSFEGELLDKESYKRLFRETEYVLMDDKKTFPVVRIQDKAYRALCIDVNLALKAGVNLDGFNVTESYTNVTEKCNADSANLVLI